MPNYHGKDVFFSYDGVTLSGAADVVKSIDWPVDFSEDEKTPLGSAVESYQIGIEKAALITLTVNYNALARTALRDKRGPAYTGKTAIFGPAGNSGGSPKSVADDCVIMSFKPNIVAGKIIDATVTIRISGPGVDLVGTLETTF